MTEPTSPPPPAPEPPLEKDELKLGDLFYGKHGEVYIGEPAEPSEPVDVGDVVFDDLGHPRGLDVQGGIMPAGVVVPAGD